MLQIGETTWVKPEHIVHITISDGKLNLIDVLHVTHSLPHDDEFLGLEFLFL